MQKINIETLTADDMLDLIQDHELTIEHGNDRILIVNCLEGSSITATSRQGISQAIRNWAKEYNKIAEATNTLDEERND